MSLLSGPITSEYLSASRQLALRMMREAKDAPSDVIVGAVVICASAMLIQFGEGEKDINALAEKIRLAIADTMEARRQ